MQLPGITPRLSPFMSDCLTLSLRGDCVARGPQCSGRRRAPRVDAGQSRAVAGVRVAPVWPERGSGVLARLGCQERHPLRSGLLRSWGGLPAASLRNSASLSECQSDRPTDRSRPGPAQSDKRWLGPCARHLVQLGQRSALDAALRACHVQMLLRGRSGGGPLSLLAKHVHVWHCGRLGNAQRRHAAVQKRTNAYRNAEPQRYCRNAETQKLPQCAEVQKRRGAETQTRRNAETQWLDCSETQ